jgi:hypothetical protein
MRWIMQNKKNFTLWLKYNKFKKNGEPLKDSSIYKYVTAIDTISKDMMDLDVIKKEIYYISDTLELKRAINDIKGNKNFNIKNSTGNNMYSVSLDHYEDYIQIK